MPALSPHEIHSLFEHAFNVGDVEALAALYESNAVLVIDDSEVVGRENIRAEYRKAVARRERITLETRAVLGSHPDLAVLHGTWLIEATAGAGRPRTGLSTEVVRRQSDGTWLFAIDNPHTPPASR